MRLTVPAKILITAVVLLAVGAGIYLHPGLIGQIAPTAQHKGSNVPPEARLPDSQEVAALTPAAPGCANLPEVRMYVWAWNAQAGLMLANGGKQAAAGSMMCQHGVNLKLIREDNADQMQNLMATFAEGLKGGEPNPQKGAHFVAIMGDGSAPFLKGLNDRLVKMGPDYGATVIASLGYSRGEDKLMGPPAWKQNPQAARGGLVAGVLRDGDWNIALKWLGDNKLPNNPDESTWDPEALNWVNASDYIDAAQKYVSGYCAELKNVKTGKKEKHCVDAVVTWTPGDVTVSEKRGGLVSIVSTKEYRSQMPHVVIGNRRWMAQNRKLVVGLLQAALAAGDQIKQDDEALRRAAAYSAVVYGEKDASYWYKYFRPQIERDKQGLMVDLGGSAVNNLADNLQTFGLAPGSANLFGATYTVFGNIVKSQYPNLMPSFYPVSEILDTSYIKEIAAAAPPTTSADLPKFASGEQLKQVVSRRSWNIQFQSGSAQLLPEATGQLQALFNDLVVAGGTLVQIHGHTDNQGKVDRNVQLSEDRAFAVKRWLEQHSPTNFPDGRTQVFAHGQSQPVDANATAEGRAKNRRVEIVLGTAN